MRTTYKQTFLFILLLVVSARINAADQLQSLSPARQEAIAFLESLDHTRASVHWPNIKPKLFYDNLKLNLENKESFYPGRSTNFCSYGALSYLVMEKDAMGYVKFMNDLYEKGQAVFNDNHFKPSSAVMKAAGTLRFKGILDIRHAEQVWFLALADKFKGYLNFFNRRFHEGDENTFWASANLSKFNRMIRRMCGVNVKAVGSDLIKPWVKDIYTYLHKRMDSTIVSLYINNRVLHKKNHDKIKFSIPTHYIILRQISMVNDMITLRYWDYGGETLLQISPRTFRKTVFGIITIDK